MSALLSRKKEVLLAAGVQLSSILPSFTSVVYQGYAVCQDLCSLPPDGIRTSRTHYLFSTFCCVLFGALLV